MLNNLEINKIKKTNLLWLAASDNEHFHFKKSRSSKVQFHINLTTLR